MALTITEVLNMWNQAGVFSYVLPFLLIFAVVFAILQKSRILSGGPGGENRALLAIVSASIGLLALQMDFVSTFFATIFPRFGIGLSALLVVLIFVGFLRDFDAPNQRLFHWIGIILGAALVIWAFVSWDNWFGGFGFGGGSWLLQEDLWSLIILAIVIGAIWLVSRGGGGRHHHHDHGGG